MKLRTSNNEIGSILHHAYAERETFTLTGNGISAHFVAVQLNAEPCRLDTGRWFTSLDLEQVSEISQVTPWNGEGHPPVGTICEYTDVHGLKWYGCEIIAYHGDHVWLCTTAAQRDHVKVFGAFRFRPIRTPEQIAEEERERAVDDIAEALARHVDEPRTAAYAMYDAGYHK
jgi:hypothetical protein